MGKPVYLGKIRLFWCDECNVPLVGEECGICHRNARRVKITPPGEVRIGFDGDMKILNDALQEQFGCSLSGIVLFNRVPHRDRMDEVIVNGKVIGNLRFDTQLNKFRISLRMPGAYYLNHKITRGYVVIDDGAIEPILSGKNLMVPGVKEAADGIEAGDEIIVRDSAGRALAVGTARMSTNAMRTEKRGMAVKIRYAGYGEFKNLKDSSIDDIISANEEHLKRIESRAVRFIKDVHSQHDLPLAVSFSGGKDSLATLLLAMESGEKFDIFFLNTGIEFPETVEYVKSVGEYYGLKIRTISSNDRFWKALKFFGPPGRDYRWCCKVTKLGPTTKFILDNYPSGLFTLVGQRRYESEGRMRKGKIWRNEWVPNQLSASPIQNWTSLEVWLYILWKNAPINPWYERGLTRIGCYLCPSSDLADFLIAREYYDGVDRWFEYLSKFGKEHGVSEEWSHSTWRWRHPPKWAGPETVPRAALRVNFEGDAWKKANLNRSINIDNVRNMLGILPEGTWYFDKDIYVRDELQNEAKSLIIRAEECVACGICLGRCPTDALYLENGKIHVHVEKCVHCLDCLGKCPAEEFH